MSKKSRFRGSFDKQHGKWDQTLSKSEPEHLYHNDWSLWRQLSWKKSLLVIWKFLGLFVKTLNVRDKYCLLNREDVTRPIRMEFSEKKNSFSQFVSAFLKSVLYFEKFKKKKMTVIADVFSNLRTRKNVVK